MDKRGFLAIALSLGVLILWEAFFAPKPPPRNANPVPADAKEGSPVAGLDGKSPEPLSAPSAEDPGAAAAGSITGEASPDGSPSAARRESPVGAPPVVVETEFARVEIERVGGRVRSWTLKRYKDHQGNPYELVSPEAIRTGVYPLQFKVQDKAIESLLNTRASFDVERRPVQHPSGVADTASESEEIKLVFSDGRGLEATKTLVFVQNSYLAEVSAEIRKNRASLPGEIVWAPGIGTPSSDDLKNVYYDGGGVITDSGTGVSRLTSRQITGGNQRIEGVLWTGLEEKYFAAVFIPAAGNAAAEVYTISLPPPSVPADPSKKSGPQSHVRMSVAVPLQQTYLLYAGPKDYGLLSGLNRGLTDLVNFHPTIPLIGTLLGPLVGMLAKFLWTALRWLHSYIPNYGVGIIILTAAIKIAFYPITQRAMVKMRGEQKKMQRVQPKVNAIKEKARKLKDAASRAKVNEEVMALYKREGINPMASLGGCLPMLVQLPILYGFLQVLNVSIELRQASFFGWIQDLSRPDPYYITPIFMGVTMFLQQRMAMTTVTDPQQRMQQRMMMIMPIVFTYMFLNLPSGLVLYWSVNNILGIVQQVLINRQARAVEAREVAAVG